MTVAFFILFMLSAAVQSSAGVVYKVGDSDGWGLAINYNGWASTKTFRVGDTIVFEYSSKMHNVVEVKKADYDKCNAGSPLKVFNSGNDSITIPTTGHYYYICGVPGHCAAGQKVDIRVPKSNSSPVAPVAAPVSTPPPGGSAGGNSSSANPPARSHCGSSDSSSTPAPYNFAPAPAPKNGAPSSIKKLGLAMATVTAAAICGFIVPLV